MKIQMKPDIVPQQEVSVESRKVIEQPERIPRTGPECIGTGKFQQIGQECAQEPKPQKEFFLSFVGPLNPCRENGHIEIEADEHVDVPHV